MASPLIVAAVVSLSTGQYPAYCPPDYLTNCSESASVFGHCHDHMWHGIDSLEAFRITPLNDTAIKIQSLNGSFADTVGHVSIRAKDLGGRASPNPLHCVDHGSTRHSNCTTRVSAYFSDVGAVLTSSTLEACGTIEWVNGYGLYGSWAHADLPGPATPGSMCRFSTGAELYHEVGSYGNTARYFTLDTINSTAIRIRSVNGSFPETVATTYETSHGVPKIAFRAKLFDGRLYRGIMRSNGDGTLGCCKETQNKSTHQPILGDCPVLSWWSDAGDRSCWQTVRHSPENAGACTE